MKNIFVGNLPFSATEDEIRQLFEAHGAVQRVSIMMDRDTGRSRGFAFVEMPDDEAGETAIQAINGVSLGGRALNVNAARPRPEKGFGGPRSNSFGAAAGRGGRRDDRRAPREPRW